MLEKNFSKQQAEEFLNELNQLSRGNLKTIEDHKDVFATKSDINRIIVWMVGLVLG